MHLNIGIAHKDYGSHTLFDGLNIPDVSYQRALFLFPGKLLHYTGRYQTNLRSAVYFLPHKHFDLYHTFNSTVLNSRRPWVCSVESIFPRVFNNDWLRRILFRKAVAANCRALLALSHNARKHIEVMNQNEPALPTLLRKTQVLYPSIPDVYEAFKDRVQSEVNSLRLLFVGGEFFRKGGDIAVDAFISLKKEFPQLSLTVVSLLNESNYMQATPPGKAAHYQALMQHHGVHYLPFIPRDKIYDVFSKHDVLLLPTLDDSFGYTVIEAMMMGLVPIASKVRAIPEMISHQENGLLLDVPTNHLGKLIVSEHTQRILYHELRHALISLIENKDYCHRLKAQARTTYLERFSPRIYIPKLRQIYHDARRTKE